MRRSKLRRGADEFEYLEGAMDHVHFVHEVAVVREALLNNDGLDQLANSRFQLGHDASFVVILCPLLCQELQIDTVVARYPRPNTTCPFWFTRT
jgi:hypothetical protein